MLYYIVVLQGRLILYSPQSEACYIMPHLNVTEKDKELSPEKVTYLGI